MCVISAQMPVALSGLRSVFWQEGVAAQSFLSRQPVRTFFPVPAHGSNFLISLGRGVAALTEAEERGGGEGKQRQTRSALSRAFYH